MSDAPEMGGVANPATAEVRTMPAVSAHVHMTSVAHMTTVAHMTAMPPHMTTMTAAMTTAVAAAMTTTVASKGCAE